MKNCIQGLWCRSIINRKLWVGRVGFSPPGIWGFSWTYFNQRGRLCPPNYCLPTRIRKPSGISVLSALHCTQQLMNQKMVLKTEFKCIFTNNAFFIVVCTWLSILESNLSLLLKTSFLTFPQYCFSNYVVVQIYLRNLQKQEKKKTFGFKNWTALSLLK